MVDANTKVDSKEGISYAMDYVRAHRMTTMIEQIARALCKAQGVDPDKGNSAQDYGWIDRVPQAHAALEAIVLDLAQQPNTQYAIDHIKAAIAEGK